MNTPASRRDRPFFAVTWLAPLIVGARQCKWAVWHRGHFNFNKTPEKDWTESNIKHTEIRNNLLAELEQRDCEIYLEKKVKIEKPNVCIMGSIDAVAVKTDRGMVFEVKSGTKKNYDRSQLMIYMWMLKRTIKRYKDIMLDGLLVYCDERIKVSSIEISEAFDRNFVNLVKNLLKEEPPRKYPSYEECRWCNIADCDERLSEPDIEEISDRLPEFGG